MTRLSDFLRRLGVGFTYGLGFGIAFGGVTWAFTAFMERGLSSTNVAVIEHHRTPEGAGVVGTIKNRGSSDISFVMVQADLRDGDGRMVDQCSGHIAGPIEAGAERGFKAMCQKNTEFSRYTIHASGR